MCWKILASFIKINNKENVNHFYVQGTNTTVAYLQSMNVLSISNFVDKDTKKIDDFYLVRKCFYFCFGHLIIKINWYLQPKCVKTRNITLLLFSHSHTQH